MVAINKGTVARSIDGAAIGAQNGIIFALPKDAVWIAWGTSFTGSPSAVNIVLEVSVDGVIFNTLDTSTVATGETRTIGPTAAMFVRARMVSNTGGTLATVSIVVKS